MVDAPILTLTVLGAVLGLDVVSFPQAMLSRPIVAATIGGSVAGDPASGLLAGAAIELMALETLPVGASRYPEWGSASVVGGAVLGLHGESRAGALTLALLAAIATGWIGGWTMIQLRRLNGLWARRLRRAIDSGSGGAVIGLQFGGMFADLLRGGLLTLLALLAFLPLAEATLAVWGASARYSRAAAVAVAASVAAAAVWKLLRVTEGARWYFAAGLALGLLAMALQ
ncbi:MAG TPA: PTS sugar transporter subunit IIC [Gemmatimonadaceae bacterium]|nr:PTS sugar transporter subunit IIC [Gemmatimonadaceae bacterium]